MDIYRKYDGNFDNELSLINHIDENVKTEITKVEELLNNINSIFFIFFPLIIY